MCEISQFVLGGMAKGHELIQQLSLIYSWCLWLWYIVGLSFCGCGILALVFYGCILVRPHGEFVDVCFGWLIKCLG